MDAYAYPDGHVWHVPHLEGSHRAENVQGHVGNLSSVLVAISFGQTRCYHVSIPNGLHLDIINIFIQLCYTLKTVTFLSSLKHSQKYFIPLYSILFDILHHI